MSKTYLVDLFFEMNDEDLGSPIRIDIGEIKCRETGELFTGTIVIDNLQKAGVEEDLE